MAASRLLIITLALLLTACAGTATPGGSPSASAPTLEGTSWVVTQIKGAATLAGHQPTIAFSGGRASGKASCNSYSGDFTQSGGTLTLGPVAMTAMACADEAVNTQEHAFTGALGEVTQVRGTADGAELLNAGGAAVLTLATALKAGPKPLIGTSWTLTGIVANQGVSSVVSGSTVTMTLTQDALSGKACNTFRGPVTVKDGALTVGPLATTKMACPTEQEGKQEATVLATLADVTGYTIDGDTLTLSTPTSTGLVFRAS